MTIKDLARETGYSVGTISRVLNNQPNVSERARDRIMAAVEKYNFSLNTNAKNLKQQHSTNIIAVVKGTANELFSALVEQMQRLFVNSKYSLVTDFIDEDDNEVLRGVQLCQERKPLGLLFLGGNNRNFLADFQRISVPCVLVTNDARMLPFPNLSSVSTDDRAAARCAVEYLIENGHRRVAVLGGSEVSDTSRLRYSGWLDAMIAHDIPPQERAPHAIGRYSYRGGYRAMQEVLARDREVSAVFAMADVMAVGAIRAIRESGLRVPEDISVVGLDGLQLGEFTTPKLTSIYQVTEALAAQSVRILFDCIECAAPARHETVRFSLRAGESVTPYAPHSKA